MGWRSSEIEKHNRAIMCLINRGYFYTVIDKDTGEPVRSFNQRRRAVRFARPKTQFVISTKELIKT